MRGATTMIHTHQTAPTQFVEANGISAGLFWRGETGAAWEFHGSDGSAGEPRLSSQLCRCGLAFIVVLRVAHPSHRGAPWCNGATARRRLRVLRVTCNARDLRCRPWSTHLRPPTGTQSPIEGLIWPPLSPREH